MGKRISRDAPLGLPSDPPVLTGAGTANPPTSTISSPSAVVHLYYGDSPPPHPGKDWTRFVCISDTHSRTFPVPSGDVLLHSGDLSSWGTIPQLKVTIDWLESLDHPAKILIAGNHDLCLDKNFPGILRQNGLIRGTEEDEAVILAQSLVRGEASRKAGLYYLEHESMDLVTKTGKRWKIYGTPAAPRYVLGSFQYTTEEQAQAIYDRVPADTEIFLTHTPPFLTLDKAKRGADAGCPHLAKRVDELHNCRLHVFGHIHEAHGAKIHGASDKLVSVNAALALRGQAIIVDLKH
ncbi:Metallo-dependent phosphatase [Dentipellis sp. KUC8613]|nr:Metallo-dependent phosphatase [Dentipellis sp. KUC8613]